MTRVVVLIEELSGIPPERSFMACREREAALAVVVPFTVALPWEAVPADLLAVFRPCQASHWQSISLLEDSHESRAALQAHADDAALCRWLAQQGIGWFQINSPIPLQAVQIPKPWGEEIWFTGIEQRGVSCAVPVSGGAVPLHWLLAAIPDYLMGQEAGQWPVLLKILAPLPDEGLGDLYLELHEEKREVYIITGVDSDAWPGGEGAIRLGVNPDRRQSFPDERHFREAFAEAAEAYEAHRHEVDHWLDQRRQQAGLPLAEPAPAAWLREQLASQPVAWQQRERVLREALESFTRLQPLRVGDVVQVPLHVPHSLQHGVRAVEFQTPVYERKILAFGQKVLTQAHWDSREGAALMTLEQACLPELPVLARHDGLLVEQVVDFEDFSVRRVSLQACRPYQDAPGRYRLLMGLSGRLGTHAGSLAAEQAWFWPAAAPFAVEVPQSAENTVFLEAIPA